MHTVSLKIVKNSILMWQRSISRGIQRTPHFKHSFRVYRIVGCHRSSKGVSCGRLLARWRRPRIIIIFSHSNHRFKLLAIDQMHEIGTQIGSCCTIIIHANCIDVEYRCCNMLGRQYNFFCPFEFDLMAGHFLSQNML